MGALVKAPKGRAAFRCTGCGLRAAGVVVNGRVFPVDRGPTRPGTPLPFLCRSCEGESPGHETVGRTYTAAEDAIARSVRRGPSPP